MKKIIVFFLMLTFAAGTGYAMENSSERSEFLWQKKRHKHLKRHKHRHLKHPHKHHRLRLPPPPPRPPLPPRP